MEATYNAVVLGRAGVGKSSIINYLYGEEVAKAGEGRSITVLGFHPIDSKVNNLPVRIFDTAGIEINNTQHWERILDQELSRRNIDETADKWFHTILYCIAAGNRIEKFETGIIKKFLENDYKVTIIYSKADQGTETELQKNKDILKEDLGKIYSEKNLSISVVPICSKELKRLDGTTSRFFGKDQLEKQIFIDFWDSILLRLPKRCIKLALELINSCYNIQKVRVDEISFMSDIQGFNRKLKEDTEEFIKSNIIENKIISEIKYTFEVYQYISNFLYFNAIDESEVREIPELQVEGLRSIYTKGFNDIIQLAPTIFYAEPISIAIGIARIAFTVFEVVNERRDAVENIKDNFEKFYGELTKVVSGKEDAIRECIMSLKDHQQNT
jgi:GTP-binding protein EngB required for normal cell division